jgi:serine protease AprX
LIFSSLFERLQTLRDSFAKSVDFTLDRINNKNMLKSRPVTISILFTILLLGTPLHTVLASVPAESLTDMTIADNGKVRDLTKYKIKEQDSNKDRNKDKVHDVLETGNGPFEVIVKFDNASGTAKASDLKQSYGLKKVQTFLTFDWLGIPDARKETIYKLADRPDVDFIELAGAPLMPEVVGGLDVSTRAMAARGSSVYSPNTAQDVGLSGKGVNICIIDSGVDDTIHESLKGKFVAGFNTLTDNIENPDDDNGHGTHVAGIALGKGGGSSSTYAGVAPAAGLIDVKVLDSTGRGTVADVIQGIDFCKFYKDTYKIDVISTSIVTPGFHSAGDDIISQAVNSAVDSGLIVTACAGNDGPTADSITSPGAADEAITVGNLDDFGTINRIDDVISYSSSRGPRIDDGDSDDHDELKPEITAIGSNIISAQFNTEAGYVPSSGCSMATPAVAGLAALLIEFNPLVTPDQIKNWLIESAEDKTGAQGVYDVSLSEKYDIEYGWGEARFLLITAKAGEDEYFTGEKIAISGEVFPGNSLNRTISITIFGEDNSVLSTDLIEANSAGSYEYLVDADILGVHIVKLGYAGVTAETIVNVKPGDVIKPVMTLVAPASGAIIQGGQSIEIKGTASDIDSGVKKVEIRTKDPDGLLTSYQVATSKADGDWSGWGTSRTFVKPGVHMIYGRVTDTAGNQNWQASSVYVVITGSDTFKPSLKITSPLTGTTINESFSAGAKVTITGTAFDSGSGVKRVEVRAISSSSSPGYKLATPNSATDWSTWTYNQSFASSDTYTVSVRATDNAGNIQWAVITLKVILS